MSNNLRAILKSLEGTCLILIMFIFVHFNMGEVNSTWSLLVTLEIILLALVLTWFFRKADQVNLRGIFAIVSAMFIGLWLFNYFSHLNIVRWPLDRVSSLSEYKLLLVFHFVFSLTVLTPVFISGRIFHLLEYLKWGSWYKRFFFGIKPSPFLVISAIAVWSWALFVVYKTEFPDDDPIFGFIVVCICKAFLTGFTEEVCFRGILQQALSKYFGISGGILLQSICYMLFHIHLGEAFSPKFLFLLGVWMLGLIFGIVTRFTSGIGWAVVIHTALDVVIECGNIS